MPLKGKNKDEVNSFNEILTSAQKKAITINGVQECFLFHGFLLIRKDRG